MNPQLAVSRLDLTAEQEAIVGDTIATAVAVNVYKELRAAREGAHVAAGSPIVCGCSCSCSEAQ